jgi:dienelactone hydrolase
MKLLVASDIFGDTPQLRSTTNALSHNFAVVSPYSDEQIPFNAEEQAYAAFQAGSGLNPYAEKILQAITQYQPDALLGFSVGASAGWLALAHSTHPRIQAAILFYGSRIRDYPQLRPCCPTRLIFAEHEKSCDPEPLVAILQAAGLEASICAGSKHGFMNELSPNYDPAAQKTGIELAGAALRGLVENSAG